LKTLYIVRHAKSSWKESNLSDLDRPLNSRGKRDAPFIGKIISAKGDSPELIVSSHANRALATANFFAEALKYKKSDIVVSESIYEAGIGSLMNIINRLDSNIKSAMIFGHNPGLTILTQYLSAANISNIPTCGIVKLNLKINLWSDAADRCATLAYFEYPKKYFPQ